MQGLSKKRRRRLQKKIEDLYGYRRYYDRDVEVQDDGEMGCGVFASRQFLPGELVLEIGGQLIRQDKYDGSTYVMELGKKWYVEPAIPAAFVNHSCSPNTEMIKLTRTTLGLISMCNIEQGSPITFDYQWEAADWIPKCQCGAKNCRGWVVGIDQVDKMKKILAKQKKKQKKKRK